MTRDIDFQADLERYPDRPFLREQSIWAIWIYRFGRRVLKRREGIYRRLLINVYWLLFRTVETITGISIPSSVQIGPGLRIYHFGNIFVHSDVVIGRNCTLRQSVTIGNRHAEGGAPTIGDNVEFGACARRHRFDSHCFRCEDRTFDPGYFRRSGERDRSRKPGQDISCANATIVANTPSTPKLSRAIGCRSIEERLVWPMIGAVTGTPVSRSIAVLGPVGRVGRPILQSGASDRYNFSSRPSPASGPSAFGRNAPSGHVRRIVIPVIRYRAVRRTGGPGALCGVLVEEYAVHIVELVFEMSVREIVLEEIRRVTADRNETFAPLTDNLSLHESDLDLLCFTSSRGVPR